MPARPRAIASAFAALSNSRHRADLFSGIGVVVEISVSICASIFRSASIDVRSVGILRHYGSRYDFTSGGQRKFQTLPEDLLRARGGAARALKTPHDFLPALDCQSISPGSSPTRDRLAIDP